MWKIQSGTYSEIMGYTVENNVSGRVFRVMYKNDAQDLCNFLNNIEDSLNEYVEYLKGDKK